MPCASAACWNSTAPYTPLVSVHARAVNPRAAAAPTRRSGLETPEPRENQEWTWRWVNMPEMAVS